MEITVTGRHFEISDALRQHIEGKVQKLVRYLDEITAAHVVLSVEKHRHLAELTLEANGNQIRGLEETHDMYESVDAVIEKVERQTRRFKQKESKKGRGVRGSDMIVEEGAEDEMPEKTSAPKVVRSQVVAVKPMSIDEASMQMELIDDDFLAFMNSQTNQMNVMYRRRDGNYGLIEPEF